MVCKIGTLVMLKVPCLGNLIGDQGVCYEVYSLNGVEGASFIFENGNYDGFSKDEQDKFLVKVKDTDFTYKFTNVIKLSNDFEKGIFKETLSL